jgi:hypothetical protein
VNRLPHDSHSPTSIPSSPVEKRSGAPHFRQGRPRGGSPSNRSDRTDLSDLSETLSSLGASRCGTKTVVVSQSAQIASREPFLPSRNARAEPHVSHSGAPSTPSGPPGGAFEAGPVIDREAAKRVETVGPSTNANSFAQDGHVPDRMSTSCCSKSIELPHSGHEFVMVVRKWKTLAPHYVRVSNPLSHNDRVPRP